jgi:hypothetical protein
MPRGTTLAACAAVLGIACQGKSKDDRAEKAPAPAPTWTTPKEVELPPPAEGMTRIKALQLDIRLPAEAFLREEMVHAKACQVGISIDGSARDLDAAIAEASRETEYWKLGEVTRKEPAAGGWLLAYRGENKYHHSEEQHVWVRRTIGATRVDCRSRGGSAELAACAGEVCMAIVAVPGGLAETAFPASGKPVVRTSRAGGEDGSMRGATLVWRDGTVQFLGPGCNTARGVVGTIEPERVETMLAAIEKSGFRKLAEEDLERECCDCIGEGLTLDTDGTPFHRSEMVCGGEGNPVLAQAISAVHAAAGGNPCD